MGARSQIEWTGASWNPIKAIRLEGPRQKPKEGYHCEHVSPGCAHCYAETWNAKRALGTGLAFKPGHRGNLSIEIKESILTQPLAWREPRLIFAGSMTDLFGPWVSDAQLDRVFAIAALATRHTFQFLTKRASRLRGYITDPATPMRITEAMKREGADLPFQHPAFRRSRFFIDRASGAPRIKWPLPNVWAGVSAEDQATADARVPDLLATPAAIRFVSAEPLLASLRLDTIYHGSDIIKPLAGVTWYPTPLDWPTQGITARHSAKLDWVIAGGENGPRPTHPKWLRALRDQCAEAGTPFFLKQWGSYRPIAPVHDFDDASTAAIVNADERRCIILCGNGSVWPDDAGEPPDDAWVMERSGKKAAGRLLDGVEHNGMPGMASPSRPAPSAPILETSRAAS